MEMQPYSDEQLMQALKERPQIRRRLEELLAVVGNETGDCELADDAEMRLTQGLRRLGQEAMQSWAQARVVSAERDVRWAGRAHREGKKLRWHTTFGEIYVDEPQYRSGKRRLRPFAQGAGVSARGCSRLLQRALTDLGADLPYARVMDKMVEH